jgi:hypothetical protein
VHLEGAAADRLASLGLTVDDIHTVMLQAHADALACTRLDAVAAPGFIRWTRTNRYLGERLLPRGWTRRNPKGLPQTVSPTDEFAIVATTGDANTGIARATPSTKYPKGLAIEEAVDATTRQLSLFDVGPAGDEVDQVDLPLLWILLYNVHNGEISSELSMPHTMSLGVIVSWRERIIIPTAPLDDDTLSPRFEEPPDDGDLDIAVVRR